MTLQIGSDQLVAVTYNGEIFNFRELRQILAARGHAFTSTGDTEVILNAYLEWGASFVHQLRGMFAFALWDGARGETLLVRDRLGIKPLFYQEIAGSLLFSSEPKAILATGLGRARIDDDGLRELLSSVDTPGHAVFAGMQAVPPGHLVRVTRDLLRLERYWQLTALPHEHDLPTTIETVGSLLSSAVSEHRIADVPVGALLSGGLDSSVVAALAATQTCGPPLPTFTLDPHAGGPEFYGDGIRSSADAPFAAEVAAHIASKHLAVRVDHRDLSDGRAWETVIRARDLPFGGGNSDVSLLLLFREVREHCPVVLSGEGADEIFGGYHWFHHVPVHHEARFPWLTAFKMDTGPASLLRTDLGRRLAIDDYRRVRYEEAIGSCPVLPGEAPEEARLRQLTYLTITRFMSALLTRKDRLSMACGVEARVPFCDHRLVQYLFNTPWHMKSYDGREKSLLRAVGRDLLPSSILDRRKSPFPVVAIGRYDKSINERLGRLMNQTEPTSLSALFDPAKVTALLDSPDDAAKRFTVERLLHIHAWLSIYSPAFAG